jgi:lipoprotein NlpD
MHLTTPQPPVRRALAVLAVASVVAACTTTPLPRPAPLPPPTAPVPAPPPPPPAPKATFLWPAEGQTIGRFDGNRNKGIDIAGRRGDPVLAAADGRVVIISNELRGYGTMVIVRHNDTFITAYAHVDRALVRENDIVRQGQKIAEMGSSGTDRVKLHFEIRRQGTAVDPEPYLRGTLR